MKVIKVRVSDEEMDPKAAEKMPHVKKAIASAKSVLSIFEKEYPSDKRPARAIKAAEAWMKNPTERNRENAHFAGYDASDASRAAGASSSAASFAAKSISYAAYVVASSLNPAGAASHAAKFASNAKSASR